MTNKEIQWKQVWYIAQLTKITQQHGWEENVRKPQSGWQLNDVLGSCRRWGGVTQRFLPCPVNECQGLPTSLWVALPHGPVFRRFTIAVMKAQIAASLHQSSKHRSVARQTCHVHCGTSITTSPDNRTLSISLDLLHTQMTTSKMRKNTGVVMI